MSERVAIVSRLSTHATIAPPAPSETIVGKRWSAAAVQSGTLTLGSLGHAAHATGATEPRVARTTGSSTRLLAPTIADPHLSAARRALGAADRSGSPWHVPPDAAQRR